MVTQIVSFLKGDYYHLSQFVASVNSGCCILHTFRELTPIMKGTHLGEFEELILLTIASLLEEAYSVAICEELSKNAKRSVKLGVVHAVLNRLEEKGFVTSELGKPTATRGGKRKRFYTLTGTGKSTLLRAKDIRDRLWQKIPDLILKPR